MRRRHEHGNDPRGVRPHDQDGGSARSNDGTSREVARAREGMFVRAVHDGGCTPAQEEEIVTYDECSAAMKELYGDQLLGHCAEVTEAFLLEFPELKRVRGFVTLRSGLRRSHWWLTGNGKIVDPTACQFDAEYYWHSGIAFYEPLNEADPEPTGKCMACARLCYDGNAACSPECEQELAEYYGSL